MNQTRRDILKAMLLAPVAGLPAVASAQPTPVPLLIGVDRAKGESFSAGITTYSVKRRRFTLFVEDKAARRAIAQLLALTNHTNAAFYRGFAPGKICVRGWEIGDLEKAEPARIYLEVRESEYTPKQPPWIAEYELANRVSFAEIPDGEWLELPPLFEMRTMLVNSQGYEYEVMP